MSNQNAEKSLDVSARTVDEAIEQGLDQMGLLRDQVDIEILREGKRGVFGLGAEDALIRLTPRREAPAESPQIVADEPPSEPAADAPVEAASPPEVDMPEADMPDTQAQDSLVSQPQIDEEEAEGESEVPPGKQRDVAEIAERYLQNLLTHMGIKAQITARIASDLVEVGEEPPLVLNVTGRDLGILIGRRSETLRALQYMLRLMVSKEMSSWQPVVVDVESYRIRRRRSLHRMAEKMAERAVNTGKRVVLEAMPAYERRVIHVALKDHPAVITKSIGVDDSRKVTIIPK